MRSKNKSGLPEWVKLLLLVGVMLLASLLTRCGVIENLYLGLLDDGDSNDATMQSLFEIAIEPIGSTMYIWGGGWDPEDAKAGRTATQIGLDARWSEFADGQDETYDFEEHMGKQEMGLDCSGYVGWVVYNLFETKNGQEGYVSQSTGMAERFSNRGWGKLIKNPHEFLPGDIVSMQGHVWISLGTCEDGSVLLVHSSPPGVSICGTEGIAVQFATEFMSTNYSDWQAKYPNRTVPPTYLENVTVFRWNSSTLKDAAQYQSFSGEEIMALLNSI